MEQFKDAYEISLWGDVPVAASGSGDNEIPAHYEEEKIGVIGSDSMTAQWRAVEPKLTQNVNGTNTFTFKMFYTYIDTITGERKDNPFQNLLVNERKVKVKWKDKWYDFVIKSCQEDSSGKSVTYTCQDQFINELSKNGFNLEFDNELGNNMGTAQELAQTVLDGTDWQLGENQDTIKQYREEPVYDITINEKRILVFYSVVQNHETYFQYWYDSSGTYIRDGTSMLVINGECRNTTATWNGDTVTIISDSILGENQTHTFASGQISEEYRAKRLVRSQETAYCPPLDRYVNKYAYQTEDITVQEDKIYYTKDSNNNYIKFTGSNFIQGTTYYEIGYGYQTATYTDPTLISDYIVNGRAFTDTFGWSGSGLGWNVYPPYSSGAENVTSYITIPKNNTIENSAIYDNRYGKFKNGIIKGEKYVFRIKATAGTPNNTNKDNITNYITSGLTVRISDGTTQYASANDTTAILDEDNYINYVLTCSKTCTYDNIINGASLRITYGGNTNYLWIEEASFFEYVKNANNDLLIPSEYDIDSVVKTEWRYFNESELNKISEKDIVFLDYSDESLDKYSAVYPEGEKAGEKIRSITGKNSNRFNWLQTIAETFECWVKFEIKHSPNDTGELEYEGGVPKKYITFVQDIGVETGLSFVYGIDLNTISRTINSDQIATKVVVSPNSNEFGKDGFCTIARADENYSKANFILDFGYYINHGMLQSGQINRDLYDSSGNGIGYYYHLRQYNNDYDAITDNLVDLKAQLDRYNAAFDNYTKLYDSAEKEIISIQTRLMNYAGLTGAYNNTKVYNYVKSHEDYDTVQTLWKTLDQVKQNKAQYLKIKNELNTQVTKLNNDIESKENQQKIIKEAINGLDERFYKKYARFIQEGSWISEDYYDDNLYYLDAESVAYTSSRPQIQYNINVLRLSALEEFKNKIFNVGDRGYVEDTEFFGYAKDANGNITNTPYKEEILISEITSVFDSPEQDTITVQNYKTQFEDLFQRITATTQSLQYNEGGYARAASIVEPTGEINSWTLAKSFEYNETLAWRATDDSIVINTTGITAVDTTNPQNMVRLSSAGLQISSDGGVTWTTGVSGAGISTQNLTAGNINVDNIQILSGSYPTFQWNKYGLSAYRFDTDSNGTISNVQTGNFVRHDQYGIYGVNNINDTDWKPYAAKNGGALEYIRENAAFGMTWDGFFMRNKAYAYQGLNEEETVYYYKNNNNEYIALDETEAFQKDVEYYTKEEKSGDTAEYILRFIFSSNKVYYEKDYKYIITNDEEPQVGKTYYIKENNEYIEFEGETFNSSLTYYEKTNEEEFVQHDNNNDFIQDQVYYEKVFGSGYTEISSDGDIIVFDGLYNRIKIGNLGTVGAPIYGIQINNNLGQSVMETIEDGSLWLKNRLNIGASDDNYRIGIGQLGIAEGETLSQVFNANDNFIVYEDGSILANNGRFMGDITGATGTFTGPVIANSGFIGGFAIGENTLISNNNSLILQSQNYSDTYIRTFDKTKEDGKTYYISQGDDSYTEFTGESFVEGTTYYEKSGQTINANNNFVVYENGTIVVKNGIFSGEVNATSGTFAGDISAATGTLGGFKIGKKARYVKFDGNNFEEDIIYYEKNDEYIETQDLTPQEGKEYYILKEDDVLFSTNDINNPSIELNGTEGSIIANNIHLGIGAVIDQYIELGSARIQNPEIEGNNRVFITAGSGALQMKDDGIANFGEITISGPESVILGDNFAIRPGLSEFNNVNISGTLKTSVFEVGTVQTVGGMMIFKEGAEVDGSITKIDGEENQYTFKTKEGSVTNIKENSTILLTSKNNTTIRQYATVISIETDEINKAQTYIVEANNDITECTNIVQISDYDEEDEKYNNNLLIGVNSNSTDQWKLLRQSFTMRQFNGIQSTPSEDGDYGDWSDPLLVLGDLSGVADIKPEFKIEGFGLYGENVYLTGSLTTKVAQNSYAGVNTLSKVMSTKFGNNDERIVFWAGASSKENVQASPFQVTEKGSIYANSGLFEGAILTKASISASKIYTAHLYGWDTDSSSEKATAPLTIHAKYDSAPGINFVNDSNDPITTILSINATGFVSRDAQFVDLSNNQIKFIGNSFNTNQTTNNGIINPYLSLIDNKIQAIIDDSSYGNIVFSSTQNEILAQNYSIVQTMEGELSLNANVTIISDNMVVGVEGDQGENHIMEYKQKINNGLILGYDLYITQSEQEEEEEGE